MSPEKLKILILEDSPVDAELMERELRRAGLDFTAVRTDDEQSFRESLVDLSPDVVLSDYSLPGYNGAAAMTATRELLPQTLFIFVSGVMGEEAAVEALKQGATDYILKDHLTRLPSVVEKAVRTRDEEAGRLQAEAALVESEKRFRSLAESAVDAIITVDSDTKVVFWNDSAERIFGYREDEIAGEPVIKIVAEQFRDAYRDAVRKAVKPGAERAGCVIEAAGTRSDGRDVPVEISLSFWETGGGHFVTAIIRDVSERQHAEVSIRKMNRSLMILSGGNTALVRATDEKALLTDVCDVIVAAGGYRMAWVGYTDGEKGKPIKPAAWAGYEDGFLQAGRLSLTDHRLDRFPTVQAIKTGKPVLAPEFLEQVSEPWRTEAAQRGYRSCIALPLIENGAIFGAVTLYTGEPVEFTDEEVELLMELAKDLSYGICSLRTRISREEAQEALAESESQIRQNLERLRRFTDGIVEAMARTVETRDPYTAGHQRRVTELALAIANELMVTGDELEGIRAAGAIHDLGKIHIPSEILSKPGLLTPLERGIIETHSQVGYDILKEVDFPWPIAEILLQHHERIDGLGYPNKLKSHAICLEARIISVADVVEAMSSHRPYRPALGINTALAEIAEQRGVLYDPEVVDACLKLFREQGFQFDQKPADRQALQQH